MWYQCNTVVFLSTLSLRRATLYPMRAFEPIGISIHALLAESDYNAYETINRNRISIHALLAESDSASRSRDPALRISIHALLAESDDRKQAASCGVVNFYPRSPCGERHRCADFENADRDISIHALLAESDPTFIVYSITDKCISIHALLAESDHDSA